jgi:hypothetical protein
MGRQKLPVTPRAGFDWGTGEPRHALAVCAARQTGGHRATPRGRARIRRRVAAVGAAVGGLGGDGAGAAGSGDAARGAAEVRAVAIAHAGGAGVAPTLQRLALTLVQSVLASHCTQALPKQAGVPPLQSLRVSHWTQALPTHAGVPPLQSLRFSHCTQSLPTQAGVPPPQSARSSQRTQVLVGRHAASGAVQSVPTVQATQVCVSRSHAGPPAAPTQSAFDAHSTQVSMKHAGVLDGQREHGPASLPASGAHASSGVQASGTTSKASSPGASRFASGRRNASGGPASIAGPAASTSMQRPSIKTVPEGHSAEPQPASSPSPVRPAMQSTRRMLERAVTHSVACHERAHARRTRTVVVSETSKGASISDATRSAETVSDHRGAAGGVASACAGAASVTCAAVLKNSLACRCLATTVGDGCATDICARDSLCVRPSTEVTGSRQARKAVVAGDSAGGVDGCAGVARRALGVRVAAVADRNAATWARAAHVRHRVAAVGSAVGRFGCHRTGPARAGHAAGVARDVAAVRVRHARSARARGRVAPARAGTGAVRVPVALAARVADAGWRSAAAVATRLALDAGVAHTRGRSAAAVAAVLALDAVVADAGGGAAAAVGAVVAADAGVGGQTRRERGGAVGADGAGDAGVRVEVARRSAGRAHAVRVRRALDAGVHEARGRARRAARAGARVVARVGRPRVVGRPGVGHDLEGVEPRRIEVRVRPPERIRRPRVHRRPGRVDVDAAALDQDGARGALGRAAAGYDRECGKRRNEAEVPHAQSEQ